jgi:hypothetical protein
LKIQKKFLKKFSGWIIIENERRKKIYDVKVKKISNKDQIKPFAPYSNNLRNTSGLTGSILKLL